jgi:hypothetical protein
VWGRLQGPWMCYMVCGPVEAVTGVREWGCGSWTVCSTADDGLSQLLLLCACFVRGIGIVRTRAAAVWCGATVHQH